MDSRREYRVFGVPGAGKTTWTAEQIERAIDKHGRERVLVSSFTRAAATEIASRGIDVKHGMVGTLHSICWHALGQPPIAETEVGAFNQEHPSYRLSERNADFDDLGGGESSERAHGDRLMLKYQLYRARMTPRALWNPMVLAFAGAWENWKKENQTFDFNDLIETALERLPVAPNQPAVGFIDEAQDLSTLQFALVRRWADGMDSVVFIGDDDQSIYGFAGADPHNLIADDLPAENLRVLSESHRLPEMVHGVAVKWIERCTKRQPKSFRPRAAAGVVERNSGTWRDPRRLVDAVEADISGPEGTSMILGSCSYMLSPIISELKARGIPYHNPYRRNRGDWNPLKRADGSIQNRVRAYWYGAQNQPPFWTAQQMKLWMDLVKSDGVLKRGVKKFVESIAKTNPATVFDVNEYNNFFEGGCPFEYGPATVEWLAENALEAKRRNIRYPIDIIRKRGLEAFEQPRVMVGTIHSVKGGEASNVYVLPDLSTEGAGQWDRGGDDRDAVRRVFYVGMTRARERLVIAQPASGLSVKLT